MSSKTKKESSSKKEKGLDERVFNIIIALGKIQIIDEDDKITHSFDIPMGKYLVEIDKKLKAKKRVKQRILVVSGQKLLEIKELNEKNKVINKIKPDETFQYRNVKVEQI
jgi:hypothetical protein